MVPSGSGLAIWKDSLYIVSDDAPFIYRLSLKDFSYEQFPLKGYTNAAYRIPKNIKPDFESAAIGEMGGQQYLFAFGSGSKTPGRDSLLIVNTANLQEQKTMSLSGLYTGKNKYPVSAMEPGRDCYHSRHAPSVQPGKQYGGRDRMGGIHQVHCDRRRHTLLAALHTKPSHA